MAFTTLKRVPGLALVVGANGTPLGAFDNLSVDVSANVATATSADSEWVQKVLTQKDGKGSLSSWLGSDFPQLEVGDEFELTVVAGVADVSSALKQAQAIPGVCRIVSMSDKVMSDPGTCDIDFEWGFIDA